MAGEEVTPKSARRRKEESILGVAMSRTLKGACGTAALMNTEGGSARNRSLPATPRAGARMDITDRIVQRYAKDVRDIEAKRLQSFVPLEKREMVKPCERAMARTLKHDLDHALKTAGTGVVGLEQVTRKEPFQKQLQYLEQNAKTGRFVEQYGAEGRYDGDFQFGQRHGKGLHEFRGEVYQGDWKWDMRDGWGTLTLADGSHIKGEWQAGKQHGHSCMTDARGMVTYEGEFLNGRRHGLGKQVFDSGDVYDGTWKDGHMHDRGVYHFSNGDKYDGTWNQGKYDGPGVFHYANGSLSRRVYRDGVLESVQDFEHTSQRFGKNLNRDGMMRHTADGGFPREVFLLSSV